MIINKFLFSSVVRGARQGESHGGLYLADFNDGTCVQVLDHNTTEIDFAGRGADRGLRGICTTDHHIFVAASNEIFVLDHDFKIQRSFTHPCLNHAHEMSLTEAGLFVTSTGYNSVLLFDPVTGGCKWGLKLSRNARGRWEARTFSPDGEMPRPDTSAHINMVKVLRGTVFLSGRNLNAMCQFHTSRGFAKIARLPLGTHNAQPIRGGVAYNDTENDQIIWFSEGQKISADVPQYRAETMQWPIAANEKVARPSFARGLFITEKWVVGGSSPSTISLYDRKTGRRHNSLQASNDVRNAVHGLVHWPY